MLLPLRINKNDKILIVAPHPDDEAIGCGGLMALYANQCSVVVVTDGAHADSSIPPGKMKQIRKKEFREEMKKANILSYKMLDYEDGRLIEHDECFLNVDFRSYSKIFLPNRDDNHLDHTKTFDYAIKQIIKEEKCGTEVYLYEVHSPFHNISHYLDITDVVDKKIDYIDCHKSQMHIHDYTKQSKMLAAYRACQVGTPGRFYETYTWVDKDEFEEITYEKKSEIELSKYKTLYRMAVGWLDCLDKGISPAALLKKKDINSVVVYGAGKIGQLLVKELISKTIDVKSIIDNNKRGQQFCGIDICFSEEVEDKGQLVIITVSREQKTVESDLLKHGFENYISLDRLMTEWSDSRGL